MQKNFLPHIAQDIAPGRANGKNTVSIYVDAKIGFFKMMLGASPSVILKPPPFYECPPLKTLYRFQGGGLKPGGSE